jgi:hypothetical protein
MRKFSIFALVMLASWTADVRAVEFQNIRGTYGPFGAKRPDNKIMPGEVYMLNFDITGLSIDGKTGACKYSLTLEVRDPKGKQIVPDKDKVQEKGVLVGLGGNVVPEVAHVVIGVDQPIGNYEVLVTVKDVATNSSKQFKQVLEVIPKAFGLIHVMAPSVGFVGQDYSADFSVVNMARDKKSIPKVTIKTRALDASGKPTSIEPIISRIPEDMPSDLQWDRQELVRLTSRYWLNRPGRFTIEIEATDEIAKKTIKFSYGLNVLEAGK